MRTFSLAYCTCLAVITAAAPPTRCVAQDDETVPHEIGRTVEKELKVSLSATFSTVRLEKGESEKVFTLEYGNDNANDRRTAVDYSIRNRVGYLELTLGDVKHDEGLKHEGIHISEWKRGNWALRFSDAVPISFDIELGVGKGVFELGGLRVKDFNLSAGASEAIVSFDELNTGSIDNLNIESGVSKFEGRNLGNANFRHFRFQGGVGVYSLDFSGGLNHEVDVDVDVGMGVMVILVPPEIGARVIYENSWISSVKADDDFSSTGDNMYESGNYATARGRMNIHVNSGAGTVKIKRPS